MTVGSRSTKSARGTCFPVPVSEKKVLKESIPSPTVRSLGICPSGWIPCSRQYNSQQALPIWTPAWPTWIEITSLIPMVKNLVLLKTDSSRINFKNANDKRDRIRRTFYKDLLMRSPIMRLKLHCQYHFHSEQ